MRILKLQPTRGRITVAGEDLRSFDKSEWARAVSIVNQVNYLNPSYPVFKLHPKVYKMRLKCECIVSKNGTLRCQDVHYFVGGREYKIESICLLY